MKELEIKNDSLAIYNKFSLDDIIKTIDEIPSIPMFEYIPPGQENGIPIDLEIKEKRRFTKRQYGKALLFLDYLNRRILNDEGVILVKLGEYKRALEYFKKSRKLTTDKTYILNNIGLTYARMNKKWRALYYLKKALKLDPEYEIAKYNIGMLYRKKGKYSKSYEYLNSLGQKFQRYMNLDITPTGIFQAFGEIP